MMPVSTDSLLLSLSLKYVRRSFFLWEIRHWSSTIALTSFSSILATFGHFGESMDFSDWVAILLLSFWRPRETREMSLSMSVPLS